VNSITGKVVYRSGKLDYTYATNPNVISEGNYTIVDTKYKRMHGNLTILPNSKPVGDKTVGRFYTPTNKVANSMYNYDGVHLGWLGYYKDMFPKNGFGIINTFNFHYAACSC
jgi:hypothetical protein